MPRDVKLLMGGKIRDELLEVVRRIYAANVARDKVPHIEVVRRSHPARRAAPAAVGRHALHHEARLRQGRRAHPQHREAGDRLAQVLRIARACRVMVMATTPVRFLSGRAAASRGHRNAR
jgi:hypothetical protein